MRILFLIVILISQNAVAQLQAPDPQKRISQLIHDQWQVKEGLPQNSVNAIVQTHDGYIWLGTYEGLVRFNGESFTVFDRSNTPPLTNNRIMSLCEDKEGLLWIGTYGGGIVSYNGHEFQKTISDSISGMYINYSSMIVDSSNCLWIISEKGVLVFQNLKMKKTLPLSLFEEANPTHITKDNSGKVWVWSKGKLYTIAKDTVREIRFSQHQNWLTIPVPSHNGGIWTTEQKTPNQRWLVYYDSTFHLISKVPERGYHTNAYPIMEDSRGTIWCSIEKGLAKYSNGFWDIFSDENTLSFVDKKYFLEDKEKNIWLGTNGSGLHRFRDANFTPLGVPEGFPGDNVWSIFEDSKMRKWIGILEHNFIWIDSEKIHIPKQIKNENYFSFLEDRNHTLWLGGNILLDNNNILKKANPKFQQVCSMTSDSLDRIFIGKENSKILIVKDDKIIDSVSLGNPENKIIRSMITDRDGSIWIGTEEGLYHHHKNILTHYTIANGLPNNWIRSIYQDREGNLWFATDGGLGKKSGNKFYSYTEKDGLFSNTIHIILEDDSSRLWMSSNKGVFVVSKKELELLDKGKMNTITCAVYGEQDGMRSAEGNGSFQQGGRRMHDGTLWFATIKGVAIVDPNQIKVNTVIPPVHIEYILVNGKEYNESFPMKLKYPVEDLTLRFAALSYRIPKKVTYKYKLEGLSDTWVEIGNNTSVLFSNLSPGTYTFRIIACNDDGFWNTVGDSVSFTIIPPFWKTWWFISLLGLLFISLLVRSIRILQFRKMRKRMDELEREKVLERERMRISQDMHDEIGSNLTAISILSELANRSDEKEKQKILEKISTSSREAIDNISHIIWVINPKNDTLENTIAYIREYVVEYFEMSSINLSITTPKEIPETEVIPDFRRNIFLTIKEAINNIIKYADAQNVEMILSVQSSEIHCTISDDGIGFSPEEISKFGNGLTNMQERITQLGGILTVASEKAKGTRIIFSVPITTFV